MCLQVIARKIGVVCEFDGNHAATEVGALAGTTGAATGPAIGGSKQLREAGFEVGVSASPLVPGITDGELEAVADAAKEAGAQWFYSGVLFLMPASAKTVFAVYSEKFPKLAKQYQQWYAKNGYAPEEYRKKISERVRQIRENLAFRRGHGKG